MFIFISILIIFFIILYILRKKNEGFTNQEESTNALSKPLTYYRCENKILGKIIKDIFNSNNISQQNDNWDIYVPCGYNNVEEELKGITVNGNKDQKFVFGLNGCDSIVSKNRIWESLVSCYGRKYARTIMPESYVLNDPNDMKTFEKDFNPSKNDIYILKKNVQRKEGLKLTRDYNDIINGNNDNYKVVQKYITNLYLINQRKVNLRVYILIVIKEGVIYFYLCRIGKCIYTNKKYNDNDLDFESNITSYNLDMSVYESSPRHFVELKEYIDNNGGDGNLLFNNIEDLMKSVSECLSNNIYQSSNIEGTISFQLFGADVIFDEDLHPYLLEFNKGPDMSPRDMEDEYMKRLVQTDMLRTVGILQNNDFENKFLMIYKKKLSK